MTEPVCTCPPSHQANGWRNFDGCAIHTEENRRRGLLLASAPAPSKWNVRLTGVITCPPEHRAREIAETHQFLATALENRGAQVVLVSIQETPEEARVDVYGWKPWDLASVPITGIITT